MFRKYLLSYIIYQVELPMQLYANILQHCVYTVNIYNYKSSYISRTSTTQEKVVVDYNKTSYNLEVIGGLDYNLQ